MSRIKWTEKKIAERQKAGYGEGSGSAYIPCGLKCSISVALGALVASGAPRPVALTTSFQMSNTISSSRPSGRVP